MGFVVLTVFKIHLKSMQEKSTKKCNFPAPSPPWRKKIILLFNFASKMSPNQSNKENSQKKSVVLFGTIRNDLKFD